MYKKICKILTSAEFRATIIPNPIPAKVLKERLGLKSRNGFLQNYLFLHWRQV